MKKIIVLLVILFAGVVANSQPFVIDQIVGIVGSKPIKQSDVEGAYITARMHGVPVRGDMKCGMFEELLTQKLLVNQAEVDSLIVEPSQVEQELTRRFESFTQMGVTQEMLERQFNKSFFDIRDDFRINLHEQMLAERMQQEILKDVKITPSEVRSFFNRIHRDSIPLINGQAQIAQIVINPPYSEEAISEVRQELLDLRRRVVDGSRFASLAAIYSECPSSAQGGDLGFQNRGDLDPEFARVAWSLREPGDISRIVESKNGFHIIQLVAKRGDQVQVRHILMTPKLNPEDIATATSRLDSIVQLIRTEQINWNSAALFFSHDERTRFNGGMMINPYSHGTFFEMTQLERLDFAAIENLSIGEISQPYRSINEHNRPVYKVVKLINRTDPRRANLRDDYSFIANMALNEKMYNVIREWVDEKIETSYIYIDESFRRCGLDYNWLR